MEGQVNDHINSEVPLKTVIDGGVEKNKDTLQKERKRNTIIFPVLTACALYLIYWSFQVGFAGLFAFMFIAAPMSFLAFVYYSKIRQGTYLINKLDGKVVDALDTVESSAPENTSGMGARSEVPPEIRGWNWGAFFLNWIWGIGNSTYIALLMFIPVVNIVMIFVLGMKGNEWAWRNRLWRDIDHFKATQRKWAIAGVLIVCVGFPTFFVVVQGLMKGDAYKLSLVEIQNSVEVQELLGTPIEPGFMVWGNVQEGSKSSKAVLNYTITGPKGEAEAFLHAEKKIDKWVMHSLLVYSERFNKKIVLHSSREKMPNN